MKSFTQKVQFIGGKGGVGKTTLASALALRLNRDQKKVLLISTDPAHNLSDLFKKKIGGSITTVAPGLDAIEIDPEKELARVLKEKRRMMRGYAESRLYQQIDTYLKTLRHHPGMEESAMTDALVGLIDKGVAEYDHIVVDTAPTGHTLMLLSQPASVSATTGILIAQRKKIMEQSGGGYKDQQTDRLSQILNQRKERYERVGKILTNPSLSMFAFVVNGDIVSLSEAAKATRQLEKSGMKVTEVILNRVLDQHSGDQYVRFRSEVEKKYRKKFHKDFKKFHLLEIPAVEEELIGLRALQTLGSYF